MKIIQKIMKKQENNWEHDGVTICFLGDSVTQGCFELFLKQNGEIETYYDQSSTYHSYVARILSSLYPSVPVNIINAGISGGNASHGASRLEKDVLKHQPDLCVVCFGLNDAMSGIDGIPNYTKALSEIFTDLKNAGIETIFMTPNMMNTEISVHLEKEAPRSVAKETMAVQMEGVFDAYINAAIEVCKENDVVICDCYSKWKKLADAGVNTTNLLANYINHPTRKMNWLFAVSLIETMFEM